MRTRSEYGVGVRVTGKRWYMPRRVYGCILARMGRQRWAVRGGFGLETFHEATLHRVARAKEEGKR